MIYVPSFYTSLLDCMQIIDIQKRGKVPSENINYKLLLFVFDI